VRQPVMETSRITPPMAIAAFIDASRPQAAAIAALVLSEKDLAATVAHLSDTTAAVHEQLAMLEAEYKLSVEMHDELAGALQALADDERGGPDSEADTERLPLVELMAQRKSMLDNLTVHLSDLRQRQILLAHGIEHGHVAMTDAFAKAAVGALPAAPEPVRDRGTTFIMAYLVVAQLRDQLQAPGFRGICENAVTTLYLTALCCSDKHRMAHALCDPMANALAMELAFKSAKEVHQALQSFHRIATEKTSRTRLVRAQLAGAVQSREVDAAESTGPASLGQQFAEIMRRARQGSPARKGAGLPDTKGGRR